MQFECKNFRCINKNLVCNGEDNCRDGNRTDEINCRKLTAAYNSLKFRCFLLYICVPSLFSRIRNFILMFVWYYSPADRPCDKGETKCPNSNKCLARRYLCDGDDDCGDNSDENPLFCKSVACTGGKWSLYYLFQKTRILMVLFSTRNIFFHMINNRMGLTHDMIEYMHDLVGLMHAGKGW